MFSELVTPDFFVTKPETNTLISPQKLTLPLQGEGKSTQQAKPQSRQNFRKPLTKQAKAHNDPIPVTILEERQFFSKERQKFNTERRAWEKESEIGNARISELERIVEEISRAKETAQAEHSEAIRISERNRLSVEKELARLKRYLGASLPDGGSVPLPNDYAILKDELRTTIEDRDRLSRSVHSLSTRLTSLTNVMHLQESNLCQSYQETPTSKPLPVLLRLWREKVFALMVQAKTTEMTHRKELTTARNDCLFASSCIRQATNASHELAIARNAVKIAEAKLDAVYAELSAERETKDEIRAKLDDALTKLSDSLGVQSAARPLIFSAVQNMQTRFAENFAHLSRANDTLSSHTRRLDFAAARLRTVEALVVSGRRGRALASRHAGSQTDVDDPSLSAELERVCNERAHLTRELRRQTDLCSATVAERVAEARVERDELAKRLDDAMDALERKDEEIERLREDTDRLRAAVELTEERVETLSDQLRVQSTDAEDAVAFRRQLDVANAECNRLTADLTAERRALARIDGDVKRVDREKALLTAKLREKDADIDRLKQEVRRLNTTISTMRPGPAAIVSHASYRSSDPPPVTQHLQYLSARSYASPVVSHCSTATATSSLTTHAASSPTLLNKQSISRSDISAKMSLLKADSIPAQLTTSSQVISVAANSSPLKVPAAAQLPRESGSHRSLYSQVVYGDDKRIVEIVSPVRGASELGTEAHHAITALSHQQTLLPDKKCTAAPNVSTDGGESVGGLESFNNESRRNYDNKGHPDLSTQPSLYAPDLSQTTVLSSAADNNILLNNANNSSEQLPQQAPSVSRIDQVPLETAKLPEPVSSREPHRGKSSANSDELVTRAILAELNKMVNAS